jgi:glycosyltransferase involved in cell wall biosynthesis
MDHKKIRIVRILNRFNLGGPTLNVSYLSRYLPEEFETLLVGGTEEKHEASSLFIPQSMGLKPLQIRSMSRKIHILNDIRSLTELIRIIRRYKPHIVHTHAAKAGLLGRLAAMICGVPVIVHTYHGHVFRNYFSKTKTRFILFIEKWLAKHTDAVICISPAQKEEICKEFGICPENKCRVIRLGFDLEPFHYKNNSQNRNAFRMNYHLDKHVPAIGIVGRLAPIKNHTLFLHSLYSLKKKNIPFRAFVIGDGETKDELVKEAQQLSLKAVFQTPDSPDYDVCFTGWIQHIPYILSGLDIVCLTSLNEGTPVSLIEAQAAGKIIVSTPVGGIPDIRFSSFFYLTEKKDFSDFAEKLEKAIHVFHSSNTQEISASSEKIIKEYHYQRMINEMKDLYLELIKKKNI